MTLIVEDGTGVSGANAYTTLAAITTYLTDRARQSENSWDTIGTPAQEAADIAATDFVDRRWGHLFKGKQEFVDVSAGRATLTFTGQPSNTETVVIDTTTYTFNTALGGANSVLIGANVAASILNLVNAVLATSSQEGVTHGSGTVVHPTVTAEEGIGDTMLAVAREKGTAGNGISTTDTITAATWSSSTLSGGGDVAVSQPLEFPRINLFDRNRQLVSGIPTKLQHAVAEYAVRAVAAVLLPDPTMDPTGRTVIEKMEKVGPIETQTRYEEGAALSQVLYPYPMADNLLKEYVMSTGGVIRG